ncbi:N-acetyltransferase family protein [Agromyces arachidis]|uniref:N-acetyltransferase family protein n=1 Tax=Agromyces arachidis TaxID=766966 RepID=UPI0040574E8C
MHSPDSPETAADGAPLGAAGATGAGGRSSGTRGAVSLRDAGPEDRALLARATLENVNWVSERFTMGDVMSERRFSHYFTGFPAGDDLGIVAMRGRDPIGVAWLVGLTADDPGYGYVSDDVPEFSIWVRSDERGAGLGGRLVDAVLERAADRGLPGVSLSVETGNRARHLYSRKGFTELRRSDHDVVMLWRPGTTA